MQHTQTTPDAPDTNPSETMRRALAQMEAQQHHLDTLRWDEEES